MLLCWAGGGWGGEILEKALLCLYVEICMCARTMSLDESKQYTGWGKSRLTVVCMENNTVINT